MSLSLLPILITSSSKHGLAKYIHRDAMMLNDENVVGEIYAFTADITTILVHIFGFLGH